MIFNFNDLSIQFNDLSTIETWNATSMTVFAPTLFVCIIYQYIATNGDNECDFEKLEDFARHVNKPNNKYIVYAVHAGSSPHAESIRITKPRYKIICQYLSPNRCQ